MSFERVLPRDLFNESKLLKCLGQLVLAIENGKLGKYQVGYEYSPEEHCDGVVYDGFIVRQEESDGSLFVQGLFFYQGENFADGVPFLVQSRYNSKLAYPLQAYREEDQGDHVDVFNERGDFTLDFLNFLGACPLVQEAQEEENTTLRRALAREILKRCWGFDCEWKKTDVEFMERYRRDHFELAVDILLRVAEIEFDWRSRKEAERDEFFRSL